MNGETMFTMWDAMKDTIRRAAGRGWAAARDAWWAILAHPPVTKAVAAWGRWRDRHSPPRDPGATQ